MVRAKPLVGRMRSAKVGAILGDRNAREGREEKVVLIKKLAVAGVLAGAVVTLGAAAASAETDPDPGSVPVPVAVFPDLQSARQMCFRGIYDRVWVACQYRTPENGKPPETELLVFYTDAP